MSEPLVQVIPDKMVIEVVDRTSPVEAIEADPIVVTVEGDIRPTINVTYSGGRGPIWLPGNSYDGTSLAAILAGYIGKQQLSNDLSESLTAMEVGLDDAVAALSATIQSNAALNGERLDAVVSRMDVAEGSITSQVSRLNAAEANISTTRTEMDGHEVRLSVAEGDLAKHGNYIATQESILKNEWTVKIQENADGTTYVAGTGLLVYPAWNLDTVYDVDDYVWFDDHAYKAIIAHTATESNVPPNASYWSLIPYATKSQFGVLADSFFVQTSAGEKTIPFIVRDNQVMINGDLTVNGLINSGALSANKIWTWSAQSKNYVPGVSGYLIDSITGIVEFNNMSLTINYSDIVDAPDLQSYVTTSVLNNSIADIQAQIDGNFTIWYYPGTPTLSNEPAVNWTDNTTKDLHVGDQYYDESTGTVYRFKYENSTYFWFELLNTDLSLALANAATAQDTADSKRRVFIVQPTGPYDIGDLWVDGSIIKYANITRISGYMASDWLDTASLGAPIGTLVAGTPASDIATATVNFNSSNDRNASSIMLPTTATNGTCIDHTVRTNGSVDISFEWSWAGNEGDIDGFQVLVYTSASSSAYVVGSNVANETVYTIPAQKRVFILYGVVPDAYYTFAVRAYRSVDKDINISGTITSNWVKSAYSDENPYLPSSTVAFSGNITGTVNNIPVANVNVWSAIIGADKPANRATKNIIYRQTTAPTGGSYTINDLWIDTDSVPTTISQWNGSSWSIIGNYTTNTNQLTDGQNLGGTATWAGVTGTGKPSDNATKNTIYRQTTAPTGGTYTTGDLWYDTDANPIVLYNWSGTAWAIVSNAVTNTNQIIDGANLGSTAVWSAISGTGKPKDNADVTQTAIDNTLDTTSGGIIVRDVDAQRYAHLTGGDLEFYDLVSSQWRLSKSVTGIRNGVCQSGATVNIGYFRSQPTVIVSPYNLQSYAAGYPSQSQTFKLEAANLRQSGVNWLFDAVAQLNLAAGIASQTGGYGTSILPASTGSGTFASTIKTGKTVTIGVTPEAITLPANTRQVSVNLLLQQRYTFAYSIGVFKVPVRVDISLQYLSGGNWVTGATSSLVGVNCSTMVERSASLAFTLGVDITQIRVIATFISDSGSTATSIDKTTPIYNTMYAEILQVTTQQAAAVITATGYASYLAIG